MAEQPIADAARKLGVPLTGDQLELTLCPTCDQPMQARRYRCAVKGCKGVKTVDDVWVFNEGGAWCIDHEREAFKWTP